MYTTLERLRSQVTPRAMETVALATCATPAPVLFDALVLDRGD